MQQITSFIGVIAVWLIVSVGLWWVHRAYVHAKQQRRLALANEGWTRVREASEIFADIRAAGFASGAAGVQARTNALLSRISDYSDFFDDVSALRAELSRTLKRDDCPPLTEILNMRRDMWAAADVLLIDDPAVFGEAFADPGAYEAFCRDAEDLLFLDAEPLQDDPIALRLALADEDMQTFVSGVEGEIADERERERLPTWREIVAYPISWAQAVPRGVALLVRAGLRAGGQLVRLAAGAGRVAMRAGRGVAAVLSRTPAAVRRMIDGLSDLVARRPKVHLPNLRAASVGAGLRDAASGLSGYARAAARGVEKLRHHSAVERVAASLRRAGDRFPDQVTQGLSRAADMARDVRARATAATFNARESALGFEAGELSLHYDFLIKAHSLRQRYAEILRRTPELTETGRQFIARLDIEKRSERLRLGTAKLRRRARLEFVRFLTVLIAALERLRDRLADAPTKPAQNTNLLTGPLHRLFLPPPAPEEAGADFPGGLRAQARSWARGWRRPSQRMRDVTPESPEEEPTEPAGLDIDDAPAQDAEPVQTKRRRQREEPPPADETDDALRRVRQLFGIRERRQNAQARAKAAANGSFSRAEDQTRRDRNEARDDADTAYIPKGQILPPLRGSRAGIYDDAETASTKRDSLRSRLSTMSEDDSTAADPDTDSDSASQSRTHADAAAHRGRLRRWLGL